MKTPTRTTAYVVVTHHYNEQDGASSRFTGPFPSEDAAVEWMDGQPDEGDALEMYALPLNAP